MASEKTLIQRSNVLEHSLIGRQAGLCRELGLINDKSDMLLAWSEGTDLSVNCRFKGERSITNLVYDQTMQGTIVGVKPNHGTRYRSKVRYLGNKRPPWDSANSNASQITSLSLSPARVLLVTELGGDFSASRINLTLNEGKDAGTFGDTFGRGGLLRHSPGKSFWASAANPYSETASFAIGTSHGPLFLSHREGDIWYRQRDKWGDHAETLAVDWLSSNIVIGGGKDGGLRLWDIRVGRGNWGRRIQHPSQINHARKVDENTIVVAGLESQLCTYDLRFQCALATPDQVTRPYNLFPAYENRDVGHLAAGFDVYGDLAAAVTDAGQILVWDVKRGIQLIQLKQPGWREEVIATGNAIRLHFADGESNSKGLKLLITAGNAICQLSWCVESYTHVPLRKLMETAGSDV